MGCSQDGTKTPPFTFTCQMRFVDQDGNSLLKQHVAEREDIKVKIVEPLDDDVKIDIYYHNTTLDCMSIEVLDWDGATKNSGNLIQDYIIEVKSPEVFSKNGTDKIRIRYQFENYYPSVVEALFNDIAADQMSPELIIFTVEV